MPKKNPARDSNKSQSDTKSVSEEPKSPIDAKHVDEDNPTTNSPENTWQGESAQADAKSDTSNAYAKSVASEKPDSEASQGLTVDALFEGVRTMMEAMALQHRAQMNIVAQVQQAQVQSAASLMEAMKVWAEKSTAEPPTRRHNKSNSFSGVTIRKHNRLPMVFGAIEGSEDSSSGEGNFSEGEQLKEDEPHIEDVTSEDISEVKKPRRKIIGINRPNDDLKVEGIKPTIFNLDSEIESKKIRTTVGIKSEPETLVSTPVIQEMNLTSKGEVKALDYEFRGREEIVNTFLPTKNTETAMLKHPLTVGPRPLVVVFTQTTTETPPLPYQRTATTVPDIGRNSRKWEERVAGQRLRNREFCNHGHSTHPDQGIGFNEDGCPVDKATTPCKVWDRRWNSEPSPQKTYGQHRSSENYRRYNDDDHPRESDYRFSRDDRKRTSYAGENPPDRDRASGGRREASHDGDERDDKSRK